MKTYHIRVDRAHLSNKQRLNTDVTVNIWALVFAKQHIVSIELLTCDHEIFEIVYA